MLFVDTKPSWRSVLLLLILSSILYVSFLGVQELRLSDEALTAAFSQNIVSTGEIFTTRVYGQEVPGFPLYSWCVTLCSLGQMPSSFTLRLPVVISLGLLALLSGLFARRIHSPFAGIVAASVVLTSFVSFRVGARAQVESVASLLLASAWYLLYVFGIESKRWWLGWGTALALVFLACFGIGGKALIIFYVPLLFTGQRMPLTEQMQSPAHIAWATLLCIALIFWQYMCPQQPFMPWNALQFAATPESFCGYLKHLVTMVPKSLLYLFPWTVVAWAPFCMAMRQFEKRWSGCHFLRVIVNANVVMFWLMPGGSPLHLLPVLGPLAVLIGVHAEIVLRRYQLYFGKILHCVAWGLGIASLGSMAWWNGVLFHLIELKGFNETIAVVCMLGSVAVALLVWTQLLFNHGKRSFRTCLLWSIFCFKCLVMLNMTLPGMWASQTHKDNGLTLAGIPPYGQQAIAEAMQKDGVSKIYLSLPYKCPVASVLVEAFYLNSEIHLITEPNSELPEDEKIVYLLSPYLPAVTTREWTAKSPSVPLGEKKCLKWTVRGKNCPWRWERPLISCEKITQKKEISNEISEVRLYQGTLKTVEK